MSADPTLSNTSDHDIQLMHPDGDTVTFDRRIKTRDDWVSGVDIVPISGQEVEKERELVAPQATRLVGKIFRNIAIFPIFRHLAKTEKKYHRFGYKMST